MKAMNEKELIEKEKLLAEYDGKDRIVTFLEMQEHIDKQAIPVARVKSGFLLLDDCIGGFESGELVVVSGRPKSGKSLLLASLTKNFEDNFKPTCWFSYEMPPRQFLARFPELPIMSCMPRQMELADIKWLEERIWEAKLKFDVNIFMIDHLHYLFDMSKTRNPSIEIGAILRKLKTLAIYHNIIIFIICHIAKVAVGQEPEGEDIRDSSFALCEPDTVLMLWRVADDEKEGIRDEAVLKVVMTRRTGAFGKKIELRKIGGLLREKP